MSKPFCHHIDQFETLWAPDFSDWGFRNRATGLRILAPGRFDCRRVNSAVNPYLMGATLLAAVDGGQDNVSEQGAPGERTIHDGTALGKTVKTRPRSLGEALIHLENDEVVQKGLPGEMFRLYHAQETDEWARFMSTVTDWNKDFGYGVPAVTVALDDAPFLDVANPAFSLRSDPVRKARAVSWYARTPYGLAVLRHKEMGELLTHPALIQGSHAWPALNGVTSGVFADWWNRSILVTEGDDHWRLRRLVNPAFSPKVVKTLMPDFERIANDLADGFVAQRTCDFMADFADPYAARVLCLLLGLPESDAPFILRTSAAMGLSLGVNFPTVVDQVEAATAELGVFIAKVLAERQADPGDDILSILVQASEDGDRLSPAELHNLALMLVFAGVDTTRNQLGLGLSMFCDHPAQWSALAADPSLDMAAATEVMRMRPTITWVSREATCDFDYGGITIAEGTVLHLYSESAGTDPDAMGDAPFDITAKRARNYGFGGGIHHCLGNIVARNDMAVAFRVLSGRIVAPRLAGAATWLADSGNTGPISLPIAFDPA